MPLTVPLTVQTLDRCLPPAMPGVTFLSGGISEEDSSIYLNEINKLDRKGAFALTFSYSRALQSSCIKIWGGKDAKYKEAQAQLLARAQANSEASLGKYVPGSQPSIEQSLYVKNYVRARHARARACRQIHASEPTSRSLLRAGLLNASEGLR